MPAVIALIARAAVSAGVKKLLTRELLAKRITPAVAKGVLNKAKTEKITSKDVRGLLKEKQLGPKPRMKTPLGGKVKSEGTGGRAGQPEKKDMATELYKQYKKKPDTKTVSKSYQKDRVTKESVIEKRLRERRKRLEEGTSPALVKKPRPRPTEEPNPIAAKAALKREARKTRDIQKREVAAQKRFSKKSEKGKALANLREKQKNAGENQENFLVKPKQPTIESRTPKRNAEKPPISELAAFTELSKAEKAAFMAADKRVIDGLIKFQKGKLGKPDLPKPVKQPKLPPIDARLKAASNKLTPEQLAKIKKIVAETLRRSGN